jgi:hypothetical protein
MNTFAQSLTVSTKPNRGIPTPDVTLGRRVIWPKSPRWKPSISRQRRSIDPGCQAIASPSSDG